MRTARQSTEAGDRRNAKRSRLGNSKQRAIYISAKGHKHPEYGLICTKADQLNGIR